MEKNKQSNVSQSWSHHDDPLTNQQGTQTFWGDTKSEEKPYWPFGKPKSMEETENDEQTHSPAGQTGTKS